MKKGYSHGGVVESLFIPDGEPLLRLGETLISKEAYEKLKGMNLCEIKINPFAFGCKIVGQTIMLMDQE